MFTARYGLIPYIKQITFRVEKVLMYSYKHAGYSQMITSCWIWGS